MNPAVLSSVPVQSRDSAHVPHSYMGMVTGRCLLTEHVVLIAMKCYYDGSYGDDGNGDSWLTLGGVAATDDVWAAFDSKWTQMLSERYPQAPYIHMIELLGHKDPFDRTNGWTLEKKRKLIEDAIVVSSQIDKDAFRWFRCSINASVSDRLSRRGYSVPFNLHTYCALKAADLMVNSYWSNCRNPETIFMFYDRGEEFMSGMKTEWLSRRTRPGKTRSPETNCWDRIENIEDGDLAYMPPLQVADMVAWAHTRALPTPQKREFSRLRDLLVEFVPATQLDITDQEILEHNRLRHLANAKPPTEQR